MILLIIASLLLAIFSVFIPVSLRSKLDALVLIELVACISVLIVPVASIALSVLASKKVKNLSSNIGKFFAVFGITISIAISLLGVLSTSLLCYLSIADYMNSTVIQIDDVNSEKIISLSSKYSDSASIDVYISGYLERSATLFFLNEHGNKKHFPISRKIHLTYQDEWYSNDCKIRYSPDDVRSGNLKIRYVWRGYN